MQALLSGSAKFIYYYLFLIHKLLPYQENRVKSPYIKNGNKTNSEGQPSRKQLLAIV